MSLFAVASDAQAVLDEVHMNKWPLEEQIEQSEAC
jgi:hypothetical protein